jgi:hypothetical protein
MIYERFVIYKDELEYWKMYSCDTGTDNFWPYQDEDIYL